MGAIDDNPLQKLRRVLDEQGVLAALRVLNARAPHRYTAIYRYEPTILRNIFLVDAYDPRVESGADVALEDAYCVALVDSPSLAFGNAERDARCWIRTSPVVSYCGVLLATPSGERYGSLCHYDSKRCQEPATEMPLLEQIAPFILAALIDPSTASNGP